MARELNQEKPCKSHSLDDSVHPGQFSLEIISILDKLHTGKFIPWKIPPLENFYHEKFRKFPPWKVITLDFEQFPPLIISDMNNSHPGNYPPKFSMSCNCLAIFQVGNFLGL